MKRLLSLLLLLLFSPLVARSQTTAVTGNVRNIITTPSATQTFVRFKLRNYGGNIPRVSGTGVIVQIQYDSIPNSTGDLSLTVYDDNFITPAGTFYTVEYWYQGALKHSVNYIITGSTFNLSTASPMSSTPPLTSLIFGTKSYVHTQSSSSVTWSIPHNFGDPQVIVQCSDPAGRVIFPDSIDRTNANTVTVTFVTAQVGSCIVMSGGNTVLTTAIGDALVKNPSSPQVTNSQPLTLGGNLAVMGTTTLAGGSLTGTFTGNPTFSGTPSFSGTPAFNTGATFGAAALPSSAGCCELGSTTLPWAGVILGLGINTTIRLSGNSATANRVVNFPDATGIVVLDTATQTLTNKVLTSPTLSSPTTTGSDSGTGTLNNKTINGAIIGNGLFADGSGLKHGRVTTGSCATTGCSVTLTWNTGFANTNYTSSCSVVDATAQSETTGLRIARITAKNTGSLVVAIDNFSGAGVTGTLECVAIHD